jgi:hypothetical protein
VRPENRSSGQNFHPRRLPAPRPSVQKYFEGFLLSPEGAFHGTQDADLKVRRKPFEDNVTALRFLAKLQRAQPKETYKRSIDRTLRAIATPDQIKKQGRFLGDFLLALDETKDVRGAKK